MAGNEWIGNPVSTDVSLISHFVEACIRDYISEGYKTPEQLFEAKYKGMYLKNLNDRDWIEQNQYLAWKLSEELSLKYVSLPEVKSGVFEGQRYVWTKCSRDVVKGGKGSDYMLVTDFSEEERAERNAIASLLRRNDRNAIRFTRRSNRSKNNAKNG